jgi:hypothetical protein
MTDLSRIHYWHYIIAEDGKPLQNVSVRFYLNDSPTTEANIFVSETSSSPTTTSQANITTDADGFFEFWLENEWNTGGYPHTQEFILEWYKAGTRPKTISNINPWPNTRKWRNSNTGTDKDYRNKFVSDYYVNRWWTHVNDYVPSASPHDLHKVDVTVGCSDNRYNKVISNKFAYDIIAIAASYGTASPTPSGVVEDRQEVLSGSWTLSGAASAYYIDISHTDVDSQYVSVQVAKLNNDERVDPKDITHLSSSVTRVWMASAGNVDITIHGQSASSSSSSSSSSLSSSSSISSSSSSQSVGVSDVLSTDSGTDKIYQHSGFSSTITDSFSSPSNTLESVAWDGSNVLSSDSGTDKVYRHSGFSSTITDSFSSPDVNAVGIAWDGSNVLSSDGGLDKIYQHSGFSATVTDSFSSPDVNQFALAWDGSNVISADWGLTDKIYKHSGFSSTVTDSFSTPATFPFGVTWDGSNILSADIGTDKIYKHSGFSVTVTDSFSSPSTNLRDISVRT